MFAKREPANVFENTVFRRELPDQPHIVAHQLIAGIVKRPFSNHRETLTGRATNDNIDIATR